MIIDDPSEQVDILPAEELKRSMDFWFKSDLHLELAKVGKIKTGKFPTEFIRFMLWQ